MQRLVQVSLAFLLLFGALTTLVILAGNLLLPVLQLACGDGVTCFWAQHNFIIGMEMLFILPFCLAENLHGLRHSSQLAMACLVYLFFAVIIRSSQKMSIEAPPVTMIMSNATASGVVLVNLSSEFLYAFSIQALAFCCQFNILPVLAELQDPTPERMNTVKRASIFVAFLLYAIFGSFGYLAFGADTQADLLSNFPATDPVITVGRVLLAVALLLKCPLMMQPLRSTIHAIMVPKKKNSRKSETQLKAPLLPSDGSIQGGEESPEAAASANEAPPLGGRRKMTLLLGETAVLLGMACVPAMCITDIAALYSLVGATCGSMICFLLPGGIGLSVDTDKAVAGFQMTKSRMDSNKTIAMMVFFFGIITLVASVAAAVQSL